MSYEGNNKAACHHADTDDDDWSIVVVNSDDDDDDGSSAAVAGHHLMSDHRSGEDTDDEGSNKSSAAVDAYDLMNCTRSALLARKKELEGELKYINEALCKGESSDQSSSKDLKPSRSSLVMDVERPTDEDTALFIRTLREGASSSTGVGKMVKSEHSLKRKSSQLGHYMDDDEEESEFSPQSPSVAMNCDVETDCEDFGAPSAARDEESKAMHKRNDGKTPMLCQPPRCHRVTLIPNANKNTVIDLTGVPPQLPILKSADLVKEGASKYACVYFHKPSKKWQTRISINGKDRYIGLYEDEKEAAVDYARAVFKYKGQAALDKERKRNSSGPGMDLSDVHLKPPILKSDNRIKEGASKYTGVCFNKSNQKWKAQITIDRKKRHIGYYGDEEEAAVYYSRALLKYRGQKALKVRKRNSSKSAALDLSGVAPQPPILKHADRIKHGGSKYAGVYFVNRGRKEEVEDSN